MNKKLHINIYKKSYILYINILYIIYNRNEK